MRTQTQFAPIETPSCQDRVTWPRYSVALSCAKTLIRTLNFYEKTRELRGAHSHIMPRRNRTLNDTHVLPIETMSTRSTAKFPDGCWTKCCRSNASIDDHVIEHHKNAHETQQCICQITRCDGDTSERGPSGASTTSDSIAHWLQSFPNPHGTQRPRESK